MITELIDEIKKDAAGAKIIKDWLGDGGVPVSQFLAESRSQCCITGWNGNQCPSNVEPHWWDKVKHEAAQTIKEHIATKNKAGLSVSQEESIGMCKSCGCSLPLKVWVPIKHIAEHTTEEQLQSYPEYCWQRNEILKLRGEVH